MNLFTRLANLFRQVKPLPEGVFHLQLPVEDEKNFRLHLRLQKGGQGILIVNASTVLHLNETAAEYAFHMIKGSQPAEVAKIISGRYRIKPSQVLQDYNEFLEKIHLLVHSSDLDPVTILGFDQALPNSAKLSAPLRLDCALTYRLPEGSNSLDAPIKRVQRELTTSEWQKVIEHAWAVGIPHIVFTGGEATLREDLPELIAFAEKNGQVTGLLTDGNRLADQNYLNILLKTGLDHIMIVLPVASEPNWAAIKNAVQADIFLCVHLTCTMENRLGCQSVISELNTLGVQNISLSVSDGALQEQAAILRNYVADLGMRMVSDLPVPYSNAHPAAFEAASDAEPIGAGKTWLYVEPDGDVLPAQGLADQIRGNILVDGWAKIYSG